MNNNEVLKNELNQKVNELSFFLKLNNIIGFLPLNLKETLTAVISELNKYFNDCKIYIFLKDDERMQVYNYDLKDTDNKLHLLDNLSSCRVFKESLPVIAHDIKKQTGCKNRCVSEGTQSYVCIPILHGKELLGSLTLESRIVNSFKKDDLKLLLAIANQLSLPIQRSNLYSIVENEKKQLEKANEEITFLNQELKGQLEELKLAEARLIQQERLAATGKLAANLAHEINNPIGVILSSLDYLRNYLKDDLSKDINEDLDTIYKHSKRISNLVKDLLLFVGTDRNYNFFDLNEIVEKTLELYQRRNNAKQITVLSELIQNELIIKGNEIKLQQVIVNIVNNAIDASSDNSHICIRTNLENQKASLEVIDYGVGINSNEIEKIFEPFYTTKKMGDGSGLGLSIVYNIIKEHEGSIVVKKGDISGTIFKICLPIYNKNLKIGVEI